MVSKQAALRPACSGPILARIGPTRRPLNPASINMGTNATIRKDKVDATGRTRIADVGYKRTPCPLYPCIAPSQNKVGIERGSNPPELVDAFSRLCNPRHEKRRTKDA